MDKKNFYFLWLVCVIGAWAVLPYSRYLEVVPSTVSVEALLFWTTLQAIPFFGLICWSCYKILPQTDLYPFSTLPKPIWLRQNFFPAVFWGVLVGITIYGLDQVVFNKSLLVRMHPPFWMGALASFYGAINEEVLLRLFLFSFLYFLLGKCVEIKHGRKLFSLWCINIFVSLIFGLGHLPAAFKLTTPSSYEILRLLTLNGIAGVVFGWLFWSRGFYAAVIAHFVTDVMIHVILIEVF